MSNQPLRNIKQNPRGLWEKIIHLGGYATEGISIKFLYQNIISIAEELFSSKVSLWVNKEGFTSPQLRLAPIYDCDGFAALTPIMQEAIQKHKAITSVVTTQETDRKLYIITAPIFDTQNLLGVLSIERFSQHYTQNEKRLFNGLILQSGITLAATRQHILDRWSSELLILVRNVSQQIIDILDIDELSKRVTQLILDKFQYYYVAIYTADIERRILQFRHSARANIKYDLPLNSHTKDINLGEGIIGQVGISGKEMLVQNVDTCQHYRYVDSLPETRSEFALPLVINNQLVGVLDVQSDQINAFSDLDALVLRALADHVVMAVSNSRLFSEVNQRANQLSIIADISKAISSILDFNHLINYIVSLIHIRFNVPRVNLFTVHPGRKKIFYRGGAGQLTCPDELSPGEFAYDLDAKQGLVSWATQNHQSVISNDVSNEPRFIISPASPANIFSQMVIPLIFGDQILGVIDLQSPDKNAFKTNDVVLLQTLADNISVAFRNANLYSTEQWRRQVSESIREVAGLLSANIELTQVLERILQKLNQNLPSDVAAIWLLDTFESATTTQESTSPLRLAAIYPDNEKLHELLVINEIPGTPCPWMLDAINSSTPVIRLLSSPYEPLGAYLNFPTDYSAIAAPLIANEQKLGLMILIHKQSGKYGSEAQSITATFASYSAVAINNTQLYEAAHDQAWVATVLLQVAEATQSITSITELLETVVRVIPNLIGLKSCALFTWDDITETFLPAVSNGLDVNQTNEFLSTHIAPGEIIAFDHLLEEKTPIILGSLNLLGDNLIERFASLDVEKQTWGLFPMVAQNNVRGAVLVNFTPNDFHLSSYQELFEEKFVIIQGIANQTAVALENLMLLQSQEEEAYTSVALLQVAQAIVSLNNLEEIIGTIVRITPLLVGVRRCAVYLSDPIIQEFHLSQTYGISKQELLELPRKYTFSEHCLLYSIQSSGNMIYRLLPDTEEIPTNWDKYSNADFQVTGRIPGENDNDARLPDDEYLKYKGRILLGIPLSIKGNVLGVMLFEEGFNPKGSPSYHIRQRRLEIITGITQQAALAIHNDTLQKEVVIRERLEREMQLAREIQTTFLPEIIPQIPGWDLDIHWRPARQVGGDFYDLINFVDGKIGIIMADVADKGMPAALFMILVRTLIRAAAKDNLSPSEILMQVNDLLVPDSKHGMFVTVIAAILSPQDGRLVYANAGHNPPVILRRDDIIQELPPTGMALGILDKIIVREQALTIDPGDKIVFYTDGVTEAFSDDDEMFGVPRLYSAIQDSQAQTATSLLSSIENTLSHFLDGAMQSDDLTIAALIRK